MFQADAIVISVSLLLDQAAQLGERALSYAKACIVVIVIHNIEVSPKIEAISQVLVPFFIPNLSQANTKKGTKHQGFYQS